MRALICTHHFHGWGGSELVALELIEEFSRQGCSVSVYIPSHDKNFLQTALGAAVNVIVTATDIDLTQFDFVYSQHQVASRFLGHQSAGYLLSENRPVFIHNHLSSFEPFEFPGPFCEAAFADIILCNSQETAERIAQFGPEFENTRLFQNPSPASFSREPQQGHSGRLNHVLSVSNHLPDELYEAFDILREKGTVVSHVGKPSVARRLRPEDVLGADALVSIGKSVQNALRARCPVYCYDWFAGPGWLSEKNFASAAEKNFSGRSDTRRRTATELVAELESGYLDAREFALTLPVERLADYSLEKCVSGLLHEIGTIRGSRRAKIAAAIVPKIALEAELYALIDREYAATVAARKALDNAYPVKVDQGNVNIEAKLLKRPASGKAFVVAIFSYRYDADLVPALLENLSPMIHGYVALDDRQARDAYTSDADRRGQLFEAAIGMGAQWVLAVDPDERFEDSLAEKIDDLTNSHGPVCWTFHCRDLYEVNRYRTDGLWRDQSQIRLFPCCLGMQPESKRSDGSWTMNVPAFEVRDSGLALYHLRMLNSGRRQNRRDIAAALDQHRTFSTIGYDYFSDDRGIVLEDVVPGRGYSPDHQEDGGVWAPSSTVIARETTTDSYACRINWLDAAVSSGGAANAGYVALDLLEASVWDADVTVLAAEMCLRSGNPAALDSCTQLVERYPAMLLPKVLLSRLHGRTGAHELSCAIALSAVERMPDSLLLSQQMHRSRSGQNRFDQPDALWRRWTKVACLHQGDSNTAADMAVVVPSYRASDTVEATVASLRCQTEPVEIVVINSGGGSIAKVLAEHMDYIRVIDVEEDLFAGAARNIGLDASSALHVAFLSSGCTAEADWVFNRMRHHRAGAAAVVACAEEPEAPDNEYSLAAHYLLHSRQRPFSDIELPYCSRMSCSRAVFDSLGYFPVGLHLTEDTAYSEKVRDAVGVVWALEVRTKRRYPACEESLLTEMMHRGRRHATDALFADYSSYEKLADFLYSRSQENACLAIRNLQEAYPPKPDRVEAISQLIRDASEAEVAGIRAGWQNVRRAKELMIEAEQNDSPLLVRRCLQDAVERWPQSDVPAMKLAGFLLEQGTQECDDEALEVLRNLATVMPEKNMPVVKICAILEKNGDTLESIREVEKACIMCPTQVAFWWRLNGVSSSLGLHSMQVYALQMILILSPASDVAQQALGQLHRILGDSDLADKRLAAVA